MNSESLVDAILSRDDNAIGDAFNGAISSKLANALEVKKVEIASNLIAPPQVGSEVSTEMADATK
jgi:hypothetical protein